MKMLKRKEMLYIIGCLIFSFLILIPNLEVKSESNLVKVNYIDVGQGDSELIQSNGNNMLIDAGTKDSEDALDSYLRGANVREINVLVATHPHADHIGGMVKILQNYKVDKVIMPKVTTNTETFKDLLTSIKVKGLKITAPTPGTSFKLGAATCTILAPLGNKYENLNNYSVVIKMVNGKNSFMFDGDAESESENEMIKSGYDISAEVLKLGHHGSRTASSDEFLDQVKPKFAIISCGKNNDYGHPHDETIKKLLKRHISFYRTDVNGSIICLSDGKNISFTTSGDPKPNNLVTPDSPKGVEITDKNTTPAAPSTVGKDYSNKDTIVYITKTGKDYHTTNCKGLLHSKIPIKLKDAVQKGYKPHKECNAPVLK